MAKKMDLTKAFYDLAKAQGPGDYSKIYQQDALSSLGVTTAITEAGLKYMEAAQLKNAYDGKLKQEFTKTGKATLLKLKLAGLNDTIFNSLYDQFDGLAGEYVAANDVRDEKLKASIEAKAVGIIGTITKFEGDLVTISSLLESKNFSAGATGTKMMEALNAISNQEGAYSDDVKISWDASGLNFSVNTPTYGTVNINSKDILNHFHKNPNASEIELIGTAGEAKTAAENGNPWDDAMINMKAADVVKTAVSNNEFKAFCTEKLFGSNKSYADQLLDHPDIKNATFTTWGFKTHDVSHGVDTTQVHFPSKVEGLTDATEDGVITREDFEGDDAVSLQNKELLIGALTDPENPAFNESIAYPLLEKHLNILFNQQKDKGNIAYNTAQNKKIFKDMTGKIRAMELERPIIEVQGKIDAINSGTEFWDWGSKGGKGRLWTPVPGEVDMWVNNSDTNVYTREQVLAEQLKIDAAYWGKSVMTRAPFTKNPFEGYDAAGATGEAASAKQEFIDVVAGKKGFLGDWGDDAPANVEWLTKHFPVAGYTYEAVDRDKIKISGFGVSKTFKVDPNDISFTKNKTRAQEIWDFMFENYDTEYTPPEIKAPIDFSNLIIPK